MTVRHYLTIGLRNQDTAMPILVPSREYALNCIMFCASVFLRKHPDDRAGVWLIGGQRVDTVLNNDGVKEEVKNEYIAALDPREIVALAYRAREEDDFNVPD